jgi:hypothetical protein
MSSYDYAADAAHEVAVAAFFKQAIADGRMTQVELDALNGMGDRPAKVFHTWDDFVSAAVDEAFRSAEEPPGMQYEENAEGFPIVTEYHKAVMTISLDIRLAELGLTRRHVELYLNYPAWTEHGLAKAYGMKRRAMQRALIRVRKSWPVFRHDLPASNNDDAVAMKRVQHIECSDTTDWLDNDKIRQKF